MKKYVLSTFASCDADVDNKNESCTAATTTLETATTILAEIGEKERNLLYQYSLNTMIVGLQKVDSPEIKQNVT